jgi:GTP cyclohydrolase I
VDSTPLSPEGEPNKLGEWYNNVHGPNYDKAFNQLDRAIQQTWRQLEAVIRPYAEFMKRYQMPNQPAKGLLHEDPGSIAIFAEALRHVFGNEVWDDSAEDTARRLLKSWHAFAPQEDPDFEFTVFDSNGINQMIIVRDIEFASLCAHHLMPFSGLCHIAYLPNKKQAGLSKFPRLVDYWATRPSVQENLTKAIADDIKGRLEAQGVAVVIESRHSCMSCRGIKARNASMITSEMRGSFLTGGTARDEFLALIARPRV